jgi:hypothetical protein
MRDSRARATVQALRLRDHRTRPPGGRLDVEDALEDVANRMRVPIPRKWRYLAGSLVMSAR